MKTFASCALAVLGALSATGAMASEFKWVQDAKSCNPPSYPRESLANHEEGTTGLRILIGVDGKAIDSEIETSSHSRKLNKAAQNALMECSFKPVPADAKPIQQWIKTEFVWKMN